MWAFSECVEREIMCVPISLRTKGTDDETTVLSGPERPLFRAPSDDGVRTVADLEAGSPGESDLLAF